MEQQSKNIPFIIKAVLLVFLTAVLLFEAFAGYKVYTLSKKQEKIRADYSTVNSVVFGLFSISEWRDKITVVVSSKIRNFDFTSEQLRLLENEVTDILHGLINKAVSIINKPQENVGGKIRKIAFNTFIDEKNLHDQVPAFASEIIRKVNTPSSKKRLTALAQSKMSELEKETYDSSAFVKTTVSDSIFSHYNTNSYLSFEKKTSDTLADIRQGTTTYALCMLGCILLFLILWFLIRNQPWLYTPLFIMSLLSAFILLFVGINTTMIEVDARIEKLQMFLMGQEIRFENQVLFFQSKSIMAVVKILLTAGQPDAVVVGILLLSFSVLFPVFKLLSLGIFYFGKGRWTKGKIISFFAFKSGKWSMADVMVIGIFMTYIGFNSILESQLANLKIENESLTSIATNNTSLQPGYIVFVGFVVYGLILSEILKWLNKVRTLPVNQFPA